MTTLARRTIIVAGNRRVATWRPHERETVGPVSDRTPRLRDKLEIGWRSEMENGVKRIVFLGMAAAAGVWICCGAVLADDSQELFEELFGREISAAATSPGKKDDADLARRMLEFAKRATNRRELQAFLCAKIYDLGIQCKEGHPAALGAMDLLVQLFPDRVAEAGRKMLAVREIAYRDAEGAEKVLAGEVLLGELLREADRRMSAYEASEALSLYRRASPVASRMRSSRRSEILERIRDATGQVKIQKETRSLAESVRQGAATQAMKRRLLMLYLVERDDAGKAATLPGVASEDDWPPRYVPLAAKPLARVPAAACVELAVWYRSLAMRASRPSKPRMLRRAKSYYERFLRLRSRTSGPDDPAVAEARRALVQVEKDLGPFEAKRGQWIDLLPLALLDAEQNQVVRRWTREAGKLTSAGRRSGMIAMPVRPAGSYELECRFVRAEGADSIHVILPVKGRQCMVTLSGWWGKPGGVSKISSTRGAGSTVRVARGHLVNNREHRLRVIVNLGNERMSVLRADLNGKEYVFWQGDPSSLSVPQSRTVPRSGAIWLDVENNRMVFRLIRLRMLDGTAEVLDASVVRSPGKKPGN